MKPIAKRTFHNCQTSNIFISQKVDMLPTNSSIFKLRNLLPSSLYGKQSAPHKTLSSDLYMEEYLKKCLLAFIKKHDLPTIFWPDLATIHYSKKSLEWYEQNGIKLVPKEANPPLSWAASYWKLLAKKLASYKEDFKKKWIAASKKVSKQDPWDDVKYSQKYSIST